MKQNGLARVTEPALYSLNFYFKRWLWARQVTSQDFRETGP